ncbi:MAG: hypothetical protein MUF38_11730 [Anaerolineae bacterium]|jgi:hypothetical protein|nr:hypothetical protein [Anaerolineae bacterium]
MRLRNNHIVKLVLLLNFALLLTLSPAAASETADWRMVLYNSIDHSLFALTPNGITETWALPHNGLIALSPSEEFAILGDEFYSYFGDRSTSTLSLFDLKTGECCETLITADTFVDEEEFGEGEFVLYGAGFNDSGTLLAFDVSFWPASADDNPYVMSTNRVAVMDFQTRELIAVAGRGDNFFAMWIGDEVVTQPILQLGPGQSAPSYAEKTMQGWNPINDEWRDLGLTVAFAVPYSNPRVYDLGEFLVTGEYISTSFIENNIRTVFPTALYNDGSSSFPAWIDDYPSNRPHGRSEETARWISDGRYMFNRTDDQNISSYGSNIVQIVSRDGTIDEIEIPTPERFLAGTPNGWLAGRQVDGASVIVEYIYDRSLIETREIVTFPDQNELHLYIRVVKPMPLGASLVDPQPFPEVPPPRSIG